MNLPERFDRYRIDALLGSGGMGSVFAAFDTTLKRRVALKILHAHASGDTLAQILREARAAAALDHPNSIQVFDVGEVDGTPFMSMEYVNGVSLRSLLESRTLPRAELVRVLSDVAKALSNAHRAGLVHRDIKPENVMVREDGVVKVLDFGIAKRISLPASAGVTQPLATNTRSHDIAGTLLYMAPEQARGESLDPRCDQFAWGLVAYEALVGRLPWSHEAGGMAYLAALASVPAPPLASIDPSIPAPLGDVVARALAKSRDERFESMLDLLAALGSPVSPSARPGSARSGAHTDPFAPTAAAPLGALPGADARAERTGEAGLIVTQPQRRKRAYLVAAGAATLLVLAVTVVIDRFDAERAASRGAPSPTASVPASSKARVGVLDLPRPATSSTTAAAAYLAGLRAERDWDYDDAISSMQRALSADPDLAAASLRLGVFLIVGQPGEARDSFAVASRLKDRLGTRDGDVLDALRPWFSVPSDPGAAAEGLVALERRYPGDAELLMLAGAGFYVVGRHAQAVDVLRRSLEADPAFAYAALHLAAALASLGRLDEAEKVAEGCVQRSGTALSCWGVRVRLAHEKGNRRACEELALGAKAAVPRSVRPSFWHIDAVAGSSPREQVAASLERWLELEDAAVRGEDEARAKALLDVLHGKFDAALTTLARLPMGAPGGRFRVFEYEPTWLLLLEEVGRLDELRKVALGLERQLGPELPPTLSLTTIRSRIEPDVIRALLVSGEKSQASFEREQRDLETAWLARAPGLAGIVWVRTRATFADSPALAKLALAALPAEGPPKYLHGGAQHLHIGKTYLLAGELEPARAWLERAAGSCETLSAPVTWIRSHYWLGRALEAGGARDQACAAYGTVIEHWGKATMPSATARDARIAARSLGCAPSDR